MKKNQRIAAVSLAAAAALFVLVGSAMGVATGPSLSAAANQLQANDLGLQSSPQLSCKETPQHCRILIIEVWVYGKDLRCSDLPSGIELVGNQRTKTSWVVMLNVTNTGAQLVSVTDDAAGTMPREYPTTIERGSTVYMTLQIFNS